MAEELKSTARHHCGQAVAALILGLRVTSVSLKLDTSSDELDDGGVCHYPADKPNPQDPSNLASVATMNMVGCLAYLGSEVMIKVPREVLFTVPDVAFRVLALVRANKASHNRHVITPEACYRRACEIVAVNDQAIDLLATSLIEKGTVTAAQITEALSFGGRSPHSDDDAAMEFLHHRIEWNRCAGMGNTVALIGVTVAEGRAGGTQTRQSPRRRNRLKQHM